jgi:hypothetical protein
VLEEFSTIAFRRHPVNFHGGREECWSHRILTVPEGPVALNVLSVTGAQDQTELIVRIGNISHLGNTYVYRRSTLNTWCSGWRRGDVTSNVKASADL